MPNRTKRISIVGAGNVARALLASLPRAGFAVDEVIVRADSARRRTIAPLVKRAGATLVSPQQAKLDAEIVWLLVSDSAIRRCASELSERGNWKGKVVLHSSGALSSDELEVLRRQGARVASAHPMMTFVPGSKAAFEGITWNVEGDAGAVRAAKEIVRRLGGESLQLPKNKKALYHAFGAFLSPLLVVHLEAAAKVAERGGIKRKNVSRFMEPIVRRTLDNLFAHIGEKNGSTKSFSGPLVRGDVDTIARHLDALQEIPRARELYLALIESALGSDLPVRNREEIRTLVHNSQ